MEDSCLEIFANLERLKGINNYHSYLIRSFLLAYLCIAHMWSYAQQDTVFIKQNQDWTADSIQYQTDTIIFSSGMTRHILVGTTVLPNTRSQQFLKAYGLVLDKVEKSDCKNQGERVYSSQNKINSVAETDSTLIVDVTIAENCCFDFLCDAEVDTSGVVNLKFQGYGTYCACDCCFGLIYHFTKWDSAFFNKPKAITLGGNKDTFTRLHTQEKDE